MEDLLKEILEACVNATDRADYCDADTYSTERERDWNTGRVDLADDIELMIERYKAKN